MILKLSDCAVTEGDTSNYARHKTKKKCFIYSFDAGSISPEHVKVKPQFEVSLLK